MKPNLAYLMLVGACTTTPRGPEPTVVADDQTNALSISANANGVYWVDDDVENVIDVAIDVTPSVQGRIMHAPLAGGPADVIADAQPCPTAVYAEPDAVYWARCDGAVLTAASGGSPTMLLPAGEISNITPIALATTKDYVYVLSAATSESAGAIIRVYKQPNVAPDVAAMGLTGPSALAVDETNLYWIDWMEGSVYQRAAAVGLETPPTLLATAPDATSIALDASHVYWTDDGGSDGEHQIHNTTIGGGAVFDYDTGGGSVVGIAVDSGSVYWVSAGDSLIERTPLVGGPIETVATTSYVDVSDAIALTGQQVFFADGTEVSGGSTTIETAIK
jgi:hypothetical protein